MRDRSLLSEAKEFERPDCANLVPLSPPCIHVSDSPYLVTVKHRGATMPRGPSSVHSARQTDRRPFAHRASTTLIRQDKLGLACESCSMDTIHLKIMNDHIVQINCKLLEHLNVEQRTIEIDEQLCTGPAKCSEAREFSLVLGV